jgi:hypothetical protein
MKWSQALLSYGRGRLRLRRLSGFRRAGADPPPLKRRGGGGSGGGRRRGARPIGSRFTRVPNGPAGNFRIDPLYLAEGAFLFLLSFEIISIYV